MSQSATPATQSDVATCLEIFEKETVCSFPHRHGDATGPQNRSFVRGFRQFSAHVTKCHACHGICTLSPLDAALPMRFAKTHYTTRLKCCACHENCHASSENVAKVLRLPHKTTFDTLQNTSECHEAPRLPRETKQRNV